MTELEEAFLHNLKLLNERDLEIERLEKLSNAQKNEIEKCTSEMSELAIKSQVLSDEMTVKKTFIQELETEHNSKLKQMIDSYQKQLGELSSKYKSSIVSKDHEIAQLEQKVEKQDFEFKQKVYFFNNSSLEMNIDRENALASTANDLKHRENALLTENASLRDQIEALKKENFSFEQKLSRQTLKIEQSNAQIEVLASQIENIESSLQKSNSKLKYSQDQCIQLKNELDNTTKEKNHMEVELKDLATKFEASIEYAEHLKSTFNEKYSILENQLLESNQLLVKVETELKYSSSEYERYKQLNIDSATKKDKEIMELNSQLASLNQSKAQLEAQIVNLTDLQHQKEIANEENTRKFVKEIESLRKQNELTKEMAAAFDSSSHEQEIQELKAENEQLVNIIGSMREDMEQVHAKISSERLQVEAERERLERLDQEQKQQQQQQKKTPIEFTNQQQFQIRQLVLALKDRTREKEALLDECNALRACQRTIETLEKSVQSRFIVTKANVNRNSQESIRPISIKSVSLSQPVLTQSQKMLASQKDSFSKLVKPPARKIRNWNHLEDF